MRTRKKSTNVSLDLLHEILPLTNIDNEGSDDPRQGLWCADTVARILQITGDGHFLVCVSFRPNQPVGFSLIKIRLRRFLGGVVISVVGKVSRWRSLWGSREVP